ncbi:hypothetical protein LAUMK13_05458 [Mycobacterium innocens]|uniref:Phosphinothricin acetyltransferase n=1 Tax=Mycobacterium innocens TaxID=2341083 RepID=A0A498QN25_9MYCO|nr:hypothetical protein LAUMK13_05458 [Mycobacterium innocens]
MQIRMATPEDASAIADIYRPYVRDTAISFETVPPSAQDMRSRLTSTLARFPWLVITDGERARGMPMPARIGREMPTAGVPMSRYTWKCHFTAEAMAATSILHC